MKRMQRIGLKAPFPWFGGKSRVAHLVWERFGEVPNYVEPFTGSLAVLLGRPDAPRTETANDKDCYLVNFWRALKADPLGVAAHCDLPVNEADLHARHLWLVNDGLPVVRRCYDEPEFYDARIAGWWVWGISCWIGSGWCSLPAGNNIPCLHEGGAGVHRVLRQRPCLHEGGAGVHRAENRRPRVVHAGISAKRPILIGWGDKGVHAKRPDISGRHGCMKGVHSQLPYMGGSHGGDKGINAGPRGTCAERAAMPAEYLQGLADRLRCVRVCCGDWSRICTKAVTYGMGLTGVFLDPPYSAKAGRDKDIYAADDLDVAHEAREWAIANGANPLLRIALCAYDGEHEMPAEWECMAWKAGGGYAHHGHAKHGLVNAERERIWFSPACIKPGAGGLFPA